MADHHPCPWGPDPATGRAPDRKRSGDDLEVLGAVRVRADEQRFAVVIDRIDQQRLAGLDEQRRGRGIGAVDQADFRGFVVARGDGEEPAGLRLRDVDEIARIGLDIDRLILGLTRPSRCSITRAGRWLASRATYQKPVPSAVQTASPEVASIRSAPSSPVARSRTRIACNSEPLVSAPQASRLWSSEWAAEAISKNGRPSPPGRRR